MSARASFLMLPLLVVCLWAAGSALAQTADDPNEGLRAEPGTTAGVTVLRWWGRPGRSYFVHVCEMPREENWRYLPVIQSGAGAVITWSFTSSAPQTFVRLEWTDQSYTGPVGDADFDDDGLSNALEVAAGWGTSPFKKDTDGDGWGDAQEKARGADGLNAAVTPITADPNYLELISSVEVQVLHGSDTYYMSRSKPASGSWYPWGWWQDWYIPGDTNHHDGGNSTDKPGLSLHNYPVGPTEESWWQASDGYSESLPPPYFISSQPSGRAYAQRGFQEVSGPSFESENAWLGFDWKRYRLKLSENLPFEYKRSFLVVSYAYEWDNALYEWRQTKIDSVVAMELKVPAGALEGTWKMQQPTAFPSAESPSVMYVNQVAPVTITLRSNPQHLAPPNPAAMFTPAPENGAHDALVGNIGIDQLGALPVGIGVPNQQGHCYVAPVELVGNVPDIAGATWRWTNWIRSKYWRIKLGRNVVSQALEWQVSELGTLNQDDTPHQTLQSVVPSPLMKIYTGDASGFNLIHLGILAAGDYVYEERQFDWAIECTIPGFAPINAATLPVRQVMAMQRNGNPITVMQQGNLYQGYDPKGNRNEIGTNDLVPSQDEIRALVGGSTPIAP